MKGGLFIASFLKRGSSWQYKISAKPKPITKSGFKTKKEAQIAAAEMEDKLNKGLLSILKSKPFNQYFKKWIELHKNNVSNKTRLHYDYSYKAVDRYFGATPIQEIKRSNYQEFINDFGSTRAKETVQKLNAHVRACVRDAVEDQVIPFDFTRKVTLTWTVQAKRPQEKHLNYNDSQKLQRHLWDKLDDGLGYYLILLGLSSGMRFGELVGLTRNDFDFENNIININKTWSYQKTSDFGFAPTKNDGSIRTIAMNDRTMNAFKRLFKKTPTNLNQLVFYSPESKYKVISNENANNLLGKVLNDLGINTITFHGLRHTHASLLLYKRVSVNYVSERLGHKDTETTFKTYSHILKEMRKEDEDKTINILNDMIV